jgi:antitoxin (DNA-binding transcriptional repressor) of toxin-antitoxin stability system
MSTKIVDVQEVQTRFPELLTFALEGNEVIIAKGRTPVARLVPIISASKPRIAGLNQGAIWTSDDFDEPLPEEFWIGST